MSKLDELQPERPGSRLRKLVSEARAGHSEVPPQVAYVSDEALTHRAIERSLELIQAHGWHHLIFKSALLMMVVCLVGCTSSTPIDPQKLPTFGDHLPGTIHVLVLRGFERPGHYHLPEDTSLGLLVDLAGLKPLGRRELSNRYCGFFVAVGKQWPAKERLTIDRDAVSIPDKDRHHRLKDSDRVLCTSICW
ncbi:MAG: hypothetical protein ACKVY0_09560 [Prosthecobacter sp.]|uniref:hypothetical protein n=1 Tax=Prosthecobacter sp. TaxID=1965333 RepID=UPI0038FF5031